MTSRRNNEKERTGMRQIARTALVAFSLALAIVPVGAQRPAPPPGAQPGGSQSDPSATADANAIVGAAKTTIPPDNSDLSAVTEGAKAILAAAEACRKAKCPVIDCRAAAAQYQALVEADTYLDAMLGALNRAASDSAAAHAAVVAQTRITSTNMAIAQEALAVQEYLYRIATTLFDLASVMDDFKNMAEKGTILPGDNLAQKLDTAYETLKDIESLATDSAKTTNDIANSVQGTNLQAPNTQPLTSGSASALGVSDETMSTLNDLKSNASDAANAIDELRTQVKNGDLDKDPGKVLGGLSKVAGKAVFRALKVKVEKQMAALQKLIDELVANLSAEERALAGLFIERVRIGTRRNAAQDALAAIRAAKEALAACLARVCGLPTVSRPRLPDYYAVPTGVVLGERAGRVGWGRALQDLNPKIAALRTALTPAITVRDQCPPGETYVSQPPPPGGDATTGGLMPHNVIEVRCPACADIALQLGRVLDEIETLRAEQARIERSLAQAETVKAKLTIAERRLADLDRYLQQLRDIIRQAQIGSERGLGFSVAGEAKQDLTLAEARRVELLGEITYLRREIERLEAERGERGYIIARLERLTSERRELRRMLDNCERTACREATGETDAFAVLIDNVVNRSGNNPFDPQNPTGSSSLTPQCTAPQPPADTRTQSCPAGQTGSIVQTRTYVCVGTTWVPTTFVTTSNTCSGGQPTGCTTPQPPTETQTQACPAGQTGLITQARSYSCVGTAWVASPFQTISNTCTTPAATGCATNFSTGSYSCGGACGISSTSLTVTSGSNSMTANPFGSNSNAGFNCSGATANSQSTNLIILGAPGHTCTLSASTLNAFGITCRNTGGGTCSSSCSR